ncbi:hypothetical protein FHS72_001875 [Loktanella ponticola]|uniref:SGNH/GDSL hydrolase family protein n=1 Tax=Yoonia ponticola TaxID=1524255 RepID=A0A7W9BKY2_9RHOB|nr:hypothetical protein [Yoonia ponticola]MBB5722251.1 hypothetical protein [Yoonia ponticola]
MADFRALARHHEPIRAYIRHRRWIDRSGVLAYAPNTECSAFSIDGFGFRRGELNGTPYDLNAAFSGQPYGLVLGSSHVFGFGLARDAQTIPSQLAAQTGMPCLNLSFPEAQLQSLHAVALRICAQAPQAPQFIALLPGGTLTRYAFVRDCDPLFGVPDFQKGAIAANLPDSPTETAAFRSLLTYARFWIGQIATLAQTQGCPLLFHPEHTAFEKPQLSEAEKSCRLTVPQSDPDRWRFETHRLRYAAYTDAILGALPTSARIANVDPARLSYLDEFHYTADGAAQIATALATA